MNAPSSWWLVLVVLLASGTVSARESMWHSGDEEYSVQERRYLLYDVNPGEGFNLRRDVYMRVANTVRQLRQRGYNFILVVPPWRGLYHWSRDDRKTHQWSEFFDMESLNRFVPVLEFDEFVKETSGDIDLILYLQAYAEGWTDGHFEMKHDLRPCIANMEQIYRRHEGKWTGRFLVGKAQATDLNCMSIQGQSSTLADALLDVGENLTSVLVERAETILHDRFGDVNYWRARRSMRYSKRLRQIADKYRKHALGSSDANDATEISENWERDKKLHGDARGGDYVCLHWRRRDFVWAHKEHVPSVKATAKQILRLVKHLSLKKVFLSTDADSDEAAELGSLLKEANISLHRFADKDGELSDGAIAIIDQWVCAHARSFVGTHQSTFSFRIQEDREMLGFRPETTFNRLCADSEPADCEQPAKWKIVYE
ncbi:GDP-fucose protein O-fucosyltransferase 2 precursor [Aphelenchoides avenae]|nr:GDP-fucose protein O-fucosyltransferase 2 precursor [Aphelenchus avenae]